MEAVECGAAALGMVLGYHGRFVSLEELRAECGVSRDGSKASNLVKAARRYGLVAKGYKKEPAELSSIRLPMIVFWNFNHFLVVEGFGAGKVFLNDPAAGPRVVTTEEFDQGFTGVVLSFEKGPEFQPGGRRQSFRALLQAKLAGNRAAFAYLVIATLALAVPNLIIPIFAKTFVDNVLVHGMTLWLRPLLLIMAATALVKGALTYLQLNALQRFESKLAVTGASRFFWHVLRLPVTFFAQRWSGDVASRVEINDTVASLLSSELTLNLANILLTGFYAALMFRYDVVLTLVSIAMAVANFAVLHAVSRKRHDANRRLQQERGKLMGTSMSGLQTIETLKATGSESDFFARWSGQQAKVLNAEQQLAACSIPLAAVPAFLTALNAAAVLAIGGRRVMDGLLTAGMLAAFQSLSSSFSGPVNRFVALGARLQELDGDLARLDDVLRYRPDPQTERKALVETSSPEPRLRGGLELRNLTFGYSRLEAPLICDFNLTIQPGQRVAIVGGSGSGKSTVAKITAGLYEPWSGEILLDGVARGAHSRNVLASSVALVDQDVFLFEGTVRENLSLWDASIPDQLLAEAAKDACIHDDITSWPGGYAHAIEEGGRNISGGQRQRLEIARAFTAHPRLLILDEATSALDAYTEAQLDENLRRRGCACLIVAHRLSTIRDCDEIIVLEAGRVVERGRHRQLASRGGVYARLVQTH
jgi:NHLM bacteriocin system ABC transporter peptidase/ATP-binding protein